MAIRHWNTSEIKTLIYGGAKRGTREAAEHLLNASQELVPVDTGRLKISANPVRETASGFIVGYSADSHSDSNFDYAIIQHEEPMNHPKGGGDHYLSIPAEQHADLYVHMIARAIGDRL